MRRICEPISATLVGRLNTITGTPTSRICRSASGGPLCSSASTSVGCCDSTPSAVTSCAWVTSGRCCAWANVVEMSRATTRSPRPSANTTSLRLPHNGTTRLTSVTVTSRPSPEATVTGSVGAGFVTGVGTAPTVVPSPTPHADAMSPSAMTLPSRRLTTLARVGARARTPLSPRPALRHRSSPGPREERRARR